MRSRSSARARALWLIGGIVLNLGLIGYFKYAGFLVAGLNDMFSASFVVPHIVLPVGISFYTFEQISYLVETRQSGRSEPSLMRYALFVSFFPHLIAGPIIRPHQLLPQFSNPALGRFDWQNFAIGTTFLLFGLFKKVILADGIAVYASPVFAAAASGGTPGAVNAWGAALAYTFQIYFDFSGYSDMAIGLGLMFGIVLPFNFNSPYKATSIIDFWHRWHMTLSLFLRDYVYIPLGGNRRRRSAPLRQHHAHDADRRALARRQLDVRRLGRAARHVPAGEPRVAQPARRTRDHALPAMERTGIHLPAGDPRLGLLPVRRASTPRAACSTACGDVTAGSTARRLIAPAWFSQAAAIRRHHRRRRLACGRAPATPLLRRPVGYRLGTAEHAGVPARRRTAGGRPSGLAADARLGRHARALLRRGLHLQHHLGQSRQRIHLLHLLSTTGWNGRYQLRLA